MEGFQSGTSWSEPSAVCESRPQAGLVVRQNEPRVLETPLDRADSFVTPAELFYVRSHSPAPKLDPATYRLQIDGAVRNPFSLTCDGCAPCRNDFRSLFWSAPVTAGCF